VARGRFDAALGTVHAALVGLLAAQPA
jgi:hypothetical protein